MKIRTIFAIGISLTILLSGCGNVSTEAAPDFTLPDGNGNMVHLAEELELNDQVVLVFYYTHACQPCVTQLKGIERDYAKYEEKGAQVIAIAVQSSAAAEFATEQIGVQFPILADSDHIVAEAYGVYDLLPEDDGESTPSVFVINKDGKIVWNHIATSIFEEGEEPKFPSCGGERVQSETILEHLLT
jgi:peroxiredoxin Q/BCP